MVAPFSFKTRKMKKLISFLFALCGAITMYAQSQIATLNHDGEIATFYGANALVQAHESAVNGDVITLSAGSFTATDITKLITIRGAGMGVSIDENTAYPEPTVLVGDFKVLADGNETNHFEMEGIRHENRMSLAGTYYTKFVKCSFYDVGYIIDEGSLEQCTFIHCYVDNAFSDYYNVTFTGIASYFKGVVSFAGNSSLFTLTNCVIESSEINFSSASLRNCIIINTSENTSFNVNNNGNVYNSLWFGPGTVNPFPKTTASQKNSVFPSDGQLFEENTFCKLTEAAKSYKGLDGTEIGIYGGSLPFDPTPTNPQIAKFNVASKTTEDGKLSVDIEIAQPD